MLIASVFNVNEIICPPPTNEKLIISEILEPYLNSCYSNSCALCVGLVIKTMAAHVRLTPSCPRMGEFT